MTLHDWRQGPHLSGVLRGTVDLSLYGTNAHTGNTKDYKVCPRCGREYQAGTFNTRFNRCSRCMHEMYERHRMELREGE